MLNENIKSIRKAKGLSQEELGIQLHVVRQTISKWEKGLSVPDADMLIALSAALETPVSALLGETLAEPEPDDFQALAEKLEEINLQFARGKAARRKALRWTCIALCAAIVLVFAFLAVLRSPYLGWDYGAPETMVVGVGMHALEWLFVRVAPVALVGGVIGACLTRRRG